MVLLQTCGCIHYCFIGWYVFTSFCNCKYCCESLFSAMCMYSVANYPVTTETTMTAPINGTVTPPALYTVEQLELIRRLRNSGISREDVANAFDTFDRLDRELGPVYNIPVTLVSYFTYFMDFLGYFFRLGWYWDNCPLQCSMVQYCYSVNCVWEITGMKYMWPVQLEVEDFRRKMESICRNELLFLVNSYWGVKRWTWIEN